MRKSGRTLVTYIVLGLVGVVAACTDDRSERADVVRKIRSDPRMADTPDSVANCLADWYMTTASPEQREALLNGKAKAAGAKPVTDATDASAPLLDCLKEATENPQ